MGLFLHEHSPRLHTRGYLLNCTRAVVIFQFNWFLPLVALVGYGGAACLLASGFADMSLGSALLSYAAGLPAAAGTRALWRYISARANPPLARWQLPQSLIACDYRLPAVPVTAEPVLVLGECHAEREYASDGNYSLRYSVADRYSITPEFSVLPAKSLCTGLLIFGSPGSGKTAYVLRPAVFQLFHHSTRLGGLVMDSKASLVEPLQAEMAAAGRLEDLLPIGPGQPTRWNPLHSPLATPATIADQLLTVIENVNGAPYSADSRWIRNGSAHLIEGVIGLLRLRVGYVTAAASRAFLSQLISVTSGADAPGKAAQALITSIFARNVPADSKGFDHYSNLVVSRMSEDEKFRAIYVSELLQLLVPLTSPDVGDIFNSPESELDMPSWPEAIDKGIVVVLDCNRQFLPALSIILGMLLKLSFQDAMLSRPLLIRRGLVNADRYMCLIIDEYQQFASIGDADFMALARESKAVSIFATQGYHSIVERIGADRTKVLMQSIRNRLILNQELPDEIAEILGKEEVDEASRSINESSQDASLHASGRFAGSSSVAESITVSRQRKHIFAPELLARLPMGQAILQRHTGERYTPVHRVFLIPYFARPGARHADLQQG